MTKIKLVQVRGSAQRIELHPINPSFRCVASVWAQNPQQVPEMEQWANRICHAVNSHTALVEALEKVLRSQDVAMPIEMAEELNALLAAALTT